MEGIEKIVLEKARRFSKKLAVKRLLSKNKDIVDNVLWKGFFPAVYLIGEHHSQDRHMRFVADFVREVRPRILYAEMEGNIVKPSYSPLNFDENLKNINSEHFKPDLKRIIKSFKASDFIFFPRLKTYEGHLKYRKERMDEFQEILNKFQPNPNKLFEAPFYYLDSDSYEIFIKAFGRLITEKASVMINFLDSEIKRIHELDMSTPGAVSIEESEMREEYKVLSDMLKNIEYANLPKFARLYERYIEDEFGDNVIKMVRAYKWFKETKNLYFYENKVDREDDPRRLKHFLHLQSVCARSNTIMYPFDDNKTKEETSEILVRTGGKCTPSEVKRLYELDSLREKAMVNILLSTFDLNSSRVYVSYSGALHIKDPKKSGVLNILDKKNIPYCRIVLKKLKKQDNEGVDRDIAYRFLLTKKINFD